LSFAFPALEFSQNTNCKFYKVAQIHYSGKVNRFTLPSDKYSQDNMYKTIRIDWVLQKLRQKHLGAFFGSQCILLLNTTTLCPDKKWTPKYKRL